jgi:hypothetical protein
MLKLAVPNSAFQVLQLDVAECRNEYGLIPCEGQYFEATAAGWKRAIDDYRHFGWELPEEVVEQWARKVEQWIEYCEAVE